MIFRDDHELAYNNQKPHTSAFPKHFSKEDHTKGEDCVPHVENNFQRRLALESIEITKHATTVC